MFLLNDAVWNCWGVLGQVPPSFGFLNGVGILGQVLFFVIWRDSLGVQALGGHGGSGPTPPREATGGVNCCPHRVKLLIPATT